VKGSDNMAHPLDQRACKIKVDPEGQDVPCRTLGWKATGNITTSFDAFDKIAAVFS
jgi:hypothetical protein